MRFSRTTLDSGATIVTESMSEVRSVSVGFWFDVGARDEPEQIAGASHFLEHLLFKGTPKRSAKDIADEFDQVGGDVNAFTGKEYTCYYSRVLDDNLPMALDVLSDMIRNSVIDPDELESERKVILEEIAMHEDAPDELVHDLFYRTMWEGHPLGRPVLGYNETISKVARDEVAAYWKERYSPNNLVVAAAGHLDHDHLVAEIERLFPDGTGRRTLRSDSIPKPAGGVKVFKRPTEQAHIVMGTEGIHRSHEDRHALAVLDTVLGGGMSSRLFQEVREKRGLAYSVYSYRSLFADTGSFAIYAGTTPQNADTVLDIFRTEIDSILAEGITEKELERSKGHVKGALVLSSEDPGSRMNRLGRQQLTNGEIMSIDELIDKFERLDMDDIRRVAGEVLGSGDWQTTVVGPFDEGAFDKHGPSEAGFVKVAVIGSSGRMGSEVCRAVEADGELELVARADQDDELEVIATAGAEVAVEFTTPDSVKDNVRFCLEQNIHVVVGATGLSEKDLADVKGWAEASNANCFVAPNFAIGAVLMMRFAAQAAPYFDSAEIVERHHEKKIDAPSGTALRTAQLMNAARQRDWAARPDGRETIEGSRGGDSDGIHVHSLRLPGSVAHQEVVLGSSGETLTIRHDSLDRASFMPGVILAVKKVSSLGPLTVGLENILDL